MTYAQVRASLLHLAADDPNITSSTIKRSLDLLSFFEIEELEVQSAAIDDWGAVTFTFAHAQLPQIAVHGSDVTAYSPDLDSPVTRLINAITCAYETNEVDALDHDEDDDDDEEEEDED